LTNIRLSESWMTEVLKKIQPVFNNHFVDVGVNIGQTLVKAYSVFDNVHYIGFEPNPVCYNYSKQLIELNEFSNCAIVPIGIGAKDEVVQLLFFSNDTADSSASIIKDFRDEKTVVKKEFVPVFHGKALTQFLPSKVGSILKVDVEGAELEVIEGLKSWINETRPIIIIEVLPVYTVENKFRLQR
jgi:FkbM family methyltransferase